MPETTLPTLWEAFTTVVVPGRTDVEGAIPEDPKDEMFLACAVDAGADMIVTGDRHLLDLTEYKGIPILIVDQFSERLEEEKGP